ncbi:MAG: serine--tRNA ligase [Chthonomonadales bacterium]|nr:serine--tRNA ligase [Chthonomonadales bacterium]
MLDIRLIREQPETVREGLTRVGADPSMVDQALALDGRRRELDTEAASLRAERNAGSKRIGGIKDPAERDAYRAEMRALGDRIGEIEKALTGVEEDQRQLLLTIPNLPLPEVPYGVDDRENVVVRTVGEPRTFDFEPKPHWEIGAQLDILDIERGVKLSGSRFYVLKGAGAALQRALIALMLDLHTGQHGYTEIYPPAVVREECLVGTGNLPKFGDNLYRDIEDDLWLAPTAEVPVTNLHREEILDGAQLPIRYVAYSPCFRRERMSAGRDVRGIKRGHQFDKVEMVKLCTPETSREELDSLVNDAEDVCRALAIPYRVVQMCTGDLSFVAAIKFDLELWAPACGPEGGEWLEVSSCACFTDFQARRASIRYRPEPGAKPAFVHTLNGSGLALPRTLIAVLENYQNEDGSVTIPGALRPYMGGRERITRAEAL